MLPRQRWSIAPSNQRLEENRRDGRAAEGAPLLREYGYKTPIEGSNPSLSAINSINIRLSTIPTQIYIHADRGTSNGSQHLNIGSVIGMSVGNKNPYSGE